MKNTITAKDIINYYIQNGDLDLEYIRLCHKQAGYADINRKRFVESLKHTWGCHGNTANAVARYYNIY